jgi:hypothetical protein
MVVGGKLYALAAWLPGNAATVCVEQKAEWDTELVFKLGKEKNLLSLSGIEERYLGFSACGLATIATSHPGLQII